MTQFLKPIPKGNVPNLGTGGPKCSIQTALDLGHTRDFDPNIFPFP